MQVAFHNKSQTGGAHSQRLKQMANGRFVIECLKLIEFATAIGDKEAVQEIRKRAASVVDDPRLRETDNRRDKAGSSQMGTNEAGSIERRPSQAQPDLRNSDGQEQPKLRFLAWQEENKKPSDGGAWHADGTPVAEKAELEVFGNVPPTIFSVVGSELAKDNPRFLQLWFSHPAIDQQSYRSVTLLDAVGKPLPLAANGSLGSGIRLPNNDNENLGWITYTLSPGAVDHTPKTADIHLEYSVGAWKVGKVIAPSFSGVMTLWRGAMLNGIGQNAAGNAFISVAENLNHVETTQLSFTATTKDGRELVNPSNTHGGPRGGLVQMEQFEFDVPLEEIKTFHLRTRPIKSVEFKNVSLQLGRKTDVHVVQPHSPASTTIPKSEPARLKLESAERQLQFIEAQFKAGRIHREKFEKAKFARDLAAAEIEGDAIEIARVKLRFAEWMFKFVESKYERGNATYEEFEKTKLARDLAKVELKTLENGNSPKQP